MGDKLKNLANGASVIRHALTLFVVLTIGIISFTRLYDRVHATEEKAVDNEESIETITKTLTRLDIQQQVIINEIEGAKEQSKEFRRRTGRSLNRILERLPPRESLQR